jgi:hypothetical protein
VHLVGFTYYKKFNTIYGHRNVKFIIETSFIDVYNRYLLNLDTPRLQSIMRDATLVSSATARISQTSLSQL